MTKFLNTRLFLGNLNEDIDAVAISSYCESWGDLSECRLIYDPSSKQSCGFGFIQFRHPFSAQKFIQSSPHYICDCRVTVKTAWAKTQSMPNFDASPLLHSTKRIFASFFWEQNIIIEKLKFQEYFSKYGIVSELFIFSSPTKIENASVAGFVVVHFVDVESIKKCFDAGVEHFIDGQSVYLRRVISSESILKRKRDLMVQEATVQAQQESMPHDVHWKSNNFVIGTSMQSSDLAPISLLSDFSSNDYKSTNRTVSPPPSKKKNQTRPTTFQSFQIRQKPL